jgi:hypothetical protein
MTANKKSVERFMRSVKGLPDDEPTIAPDGSDTKALARELYVKFIEDMKKHEQTRIVNAKLFDGKTITTDDVLDQEMAMPADQVHFGTLEHLAHYRPESALTKWEEVKTAAQEEVASGWHAGRAVVVDAWDRACFLAIREHYHRQWPPRSGVESMLLDEMAQYEILRRKLLQELSKHFWMLKEKHVSPDAFTRTVDRMQRLFQETLRTLLILRRSRSPVAVTRAATLAEPNDSESNESAVTEAES